MTFPADLPQKEKDLARTLVTELEQTGGDATKIVGVKAHVSKELNSFPYEERDKIARAMEATYLSDKSLGKNLPELNFSFAAPPNKDSWTEIAWSMKAGCTSANTGGPEHLLDISVRDKSGMGFLKDAYDMPGESNAWRSLYPFNMPAMAAALEADSKDTATRFGKTIATADRH
jgi:hypothetical protein